MTAPDEHVKPGEQISCYTIEEQIAVGGFGTVWRGRDGETGRQVAIKVLHAHLISSEILALRLEREAGAIARLCHRNIVALESHGRLRDGRPYLVMEYLEGQDLGTHIALRGTLSPDRIVLILEQLGAALTAAHDEGIIHRDLKASNVILSERDDGLRVVLFDFGIAKLLDHQGPRLTLSSALLGSPACMSPEQILGLEVDERTDVYALGSLTYQMLVGHPPFSGAGATSLLTMHLEEYPPYPSQHGDIPPEFDAVVMKAMSKEPGARYATVAEMVAAFGAVSRPEVMAHLAAPRRALGLFVDVRADAEALAEPDDALLDDLETPVAEAARILASRGFVTALERGDSALFVALMPDEPGAARALCRREVNTALSILDVLRTRATRDARVTVHLYLHIGEVVFAERQVVSGDLLDTSSWAIPLPDRSSAHRADGVVLASIEVLQDLTLETRPIAPRSPIHYIVDPWLGSR